MNIARTDYLNIFLMLLSCIIAFNLPFELFLFSYAILGPLHYLTEIGWLHQKGYFAEGKKDYLFLVGCSIVITMIFLWTKYPDVLPFFSPSGDPSVKAFQDELTSVFPALVFLALSSAVAMCFPARWWMKAGVVALSAIAGFYWRKADEFVILFSILVPTLVHVWLFTGLFILSGAMKNRQLSSFLSLVVFALCSLSFFFSTYRLTLYPVTGYTEKAFQEGGFGFINMGIKSLLYGASKTYSMNQGAGLKIQRFIAFAYTYHYLNWFSKTNVIRWHQVPRPWLVSTLLLWALSIGLYLYDYKTGAFALYFLSITHVFLEFPLNVRTISSFGLSFRGSSGKTGKPKVLFKP